MSESAQNSKDHVSIGSWIGFMILMTIPLVNVIVIFSEAFGSDRNPSKQNFCRAYLILCILTLVCTIFMLVLFGAALSTVLENLDLGNMEQMMQNLEKSIQNTSPSPVLP